MAQCGTVTVVSDGSSDPSPEPTPPRDIPYIGEPTLQNRRFVAAAGVAGLGAVLLLTGQ